MILQQIMSERYTAVLETAAGYAATGIPLITSSARGLGPAGVTDDIGIYWFIPTLARLLHLPIDRAIGLFFGGLVVLALAVGLLGAFLIVKTRPGRGATLLGLPLVAYIAFTIGDVYIMPAAVTLAVIPWILYATTDRCPFGLTLLVGALGGAGIAAAHVVRSHSGTALLIVLGVLLLFSGRRITRKRMGLVAALLAGMLVPYLGFSGLVDRRDAYLSSHGIQPVESRHVFWHSVYLGFGFLANEHGIRYEDAVAIARVHQINPGAVYGSAEYERIARSEVFKLARTDPRLIGMTLFAKFGVLLFYLIAFGGIGVAMALRRANPPPLNLAFGAAILFSLIPPMLIMPSASYLTGFMALCVWFGVLGIEHDARRRRSLPGSADHGPAASAA